MKLYAASLLFPIVLPPIPDGALLTDGGRILEVGGRDDLVKRHPSAPLEELDGAVILPGLVNVHTHLELSALKGTLPLGSFVDWIIGLIERRRELDEGFYHRSTNQGVEELIRSGVTCVGEITTTGMSFEVLQNSGLRGVVYREVLSPDPAKADQIAERAEVEVQAMQAKAGGLLKVGLSPHAPYSLSEPLLRHVGALALRLKLPLAIHLAEMAEEVVYIREGAGLIREKLLPRVGWEGPSHEIRGETPVRLLARLGLLSPSTLAVHAIHLEEEDQDLLASRGVAIAHCPRSNAFLNTGVAPLPAYLARGMQVGLGTDSLASNVSLSLWDEMRFAFRLHKGKVSAEQLLRMATLGGAEALGVGGLIGSIESGKRADLTAITCEDLDGKDLYSSLLATVHSEDVLLTMVDGRVVYRRGSGGVHS